MSTRCFSSARENVRFPWWRDQDHHGKVDQCGDLHQAYPRRPRAVVSLHWLLQRWSVQRCKGRWVGASRTLQQAVVRAHDDPHRWTQEIVVFSCCRLVTTNICWFVFYCELRFREKKYLLKNISNREDTWEEKLFFRDCSGGVHVKLERFSAVHCFHIRINKVEDYLPGPLVGRNVYPCLPDGMFRVVFIIWWSTCTIRTQISWSKRWLCGTKSWFSARHQDLNPMYEKTKFPERKQLRRALLLSSR